MANDGLTNDSGEHPAQLMPFDFQRLRRRRDAQKARTLDLWSGTPRRPQPPQRGCHLRLILSPTQ